MNKLSKLIEGMGEEDLLKIKRDLISGNVDKLVNKRISEMSHERFDSKTCPICGSEINDSAFVLEFGKDYLRRKAYFDAKDCLMYFVSVKMGKQEKENENEFSD